MAHCATFVIHQPEGRKGWHVKAILADGSEHQLGKRMAEEKEEEEVRWGWTTTGGAAAAAAAAAARRLVRVAEIASSRIRARKM